MSYHTSETYSAFIHLHRVDVHAVGERVDVEFVEVNPKVVERSTQLTEENLLVGAAGTVPNLDVFLERVRGFVGLDNGEGLVHGFRHHSLVPVQRVVVFSAEECRCGREVQVVAARLLQVLRMYLEVDNTHK